MAGGKPVTPEWHVGPTIDASSLMWKFFREHPFLSGRQELATVAARSPVRPSDRRLKQAPRPGTPLALERGGSGTDPGSARVAQGVAAAYSER